MRGLWETTTVEALVERGVLARPMDGNHGSIHPKTIDFVDAGIPFVMASDLENGRVNLRSCAFLAEDQARSLRKGFSLEGDVLLTHKATIGRTAIVPETSYPFIMLTPQVTYYRVLDYSLLNNNFLKLYFESKIFTDILNSWAGSGSTRAYIGITEQKKLPIMLPPIGEQLEIVRVIKPIDDKIELNRRMNETLEAMAQAIFRDWFVDFGPVRRKLAGATDPVEIMGGLVTDPVRAAELTAVFPAKMDSDVPEGWTQTSVYDIASVQYGAPFASSRFNNTRSGRPLIRIRDLPSHGSDIFTDEVHPKEYMIRAGDIVVGMDGEFRAHLWRGLDSLMNQRVCAFIPRHPHLRAFTWFSINPLLEGMEQAAVGTTVIHLGKKDIDRFKVLDPGARVAAEFGRLAEPLLDRLVLSGSESRTLAQTRNYLLPRLMSGEVRIGDAAKEIAA